MQPEVGFSPEGIVLSLHLFSAPGHRSEETEKTKKEKFILRLALIIYSISHVIYQKITHRTSAKAPTVIQVIYTTVLPGAFSLPHFPFLSSYNCCTVMNMNYALKIQLAVKRLVPPWFILFYGITLHILPEYIKAFLSL